MKLLLWISGLMILIPALLRPQTPARIEADSSDTPLVISGRLGEENGLTGNLRLTARAANEISFVFLASDLKHESSDRVISRQNISLIGDPVLQPGVPKDFQVAVSNIDLPGIYRGQIEFVLPGHGRPAALKIELTVIAKTRPDLTPLSGTEQLSFRLVNCTSKVDCFLARLFLPAGALINGWQLQFANDSPADINILDMEIVVQGEQTGHQLTGSTLILPENPPPLPAKEITSLPLKLNRGAIPPDHYTGTLYLSLVEGEDRLALPLDMNMRSGPLLPLLVLFLGIVLGRLFKYMEERGQPQSEALQKVNELQALVDRTHPDDKKILQPMVDDLRQLVYQEKLETVEAQIAVIKERMEALKKLREMEASLREKQQHPKVPQVMQQMENARKSFSEGNDSQAKEYIDLVKKDLGGLASLMGTKEEKEQANRMIDEAGNAAERASRGPVLPKPPSKMITTFRSWMVFLSGLSNEIRAEAALWLVRPLLYFAVLIGLCLVGVESLYVNNGLTFGANPLTDYMALIIWGLGADVSSRTLGNLRGGS